MKIDVLTLFPELFVPFLEWSMIKKARETDAIEIHIHNLRKWGIDKRGTVDDRPYGGGAGMILRIEPIFNALCALKLKGQNSNVKSKSKISNRKSKIILLSPRGNQLDQKMAGRLAKLDRITLICGHYEGVDERAKHLIDEEISIGNYVLSGGEIPAMVIVDAVSRLLPKVLEKEGASEIESFSPGLNKMLKSYNPQLVTRNSLTSFTEFPHYTRPPIFNGWKVPKVLLSGNHKEISRWRAKKIKLKKNGKCH